LPKIEHIIVFKKNAFLRRKLPKIAENCDHNIDPRSARVKTAAFRRGVKRLEKVEKSQRFLMTSFVQMSLIFFGIFIGILSLASPAVVASLLSLCLCPCPSFSTMVSTLSLSFSFFLYFFLSLSLSLFLSFFLSLSLSLSLSFFISLSLPLCLSFSLSLFRNLDFLLLFTPEFSVF
jgi:hypothetical protein